MRVRGAVTLVASVAAMAVAPGIAAAQSPVTDEYITNCQPRAIVNAAGVCIEPNAPNAPSTPLAPPDSGIQSVSPGPRGTVTGTVPVSDNGGSTGTTPSAGKLPFTGAGWLGTLAMLGMAMLAAGAALQLGGRAARRVLR
jgi:hypothetical protein